MYFFLFLALNCFQCSLYPRWKALGEQKCFSNLTSSYTFINTNRPMHHNICSCLIKGPGPSGYQLFSYLFHLLDRSFSRAEAAQRWHIVCAQ